MESFSCEFCQNLSAYSCILDCGHTICYQCVDYQLNSQYSDYKDERYFNCPVCNSISLLPENLLQSIRQNLYLPVMIHGCDLVDLRCGCGKPAVLECVNCEQCVCVFCKDLHDNHLLLQVEDICQEHSLEFIYYCETDLVPLCQVCVQSHYDEKHKIWHKTQIMQRFWLTIHDINENKAKLLETSKKGEEIGGEHRDSNKAFQHLLSFSPTTWHGKVHQIFQLLSLSYPRTEELTPFLSDSSPITQQILAHLTTQPNPPPTTNTLVYVTRGSTELFIYNFKTQSFNPMKISEKILKWSGILQISANTLLVTGGKPSKNLGSIPACFSVNIETCLIEPFPDMLSCHSSHVSLQHNSDIYVISGKNNLNGISTCCERLNLKSMTWEEVADNIQGRTCAAGTVHKERIFIIGGCKNNTIEKYCIELNTWELLTFKLFDVVWQHLAISVGERVLVFGGDSIYDAPTRFSFLIDFENEEISQVEVLPVSQCWLCGWYPYMIRGNRIWVMNKELKFLSYNLNTQEWTSFKNKARKTK